MQAVEHNNFKQTQAFPNWIYVGFPVPYHVILTFQLLVDLKMWTWCSHLPLELKPKNNLVLYKFFPRYIPCIFLGLCPLLQVDYYVLYVADFFQNLYPVDIKKCNFTHTMEKRCIDICNYYRKLFQKIITSVSKNIQSNFNRHRILISV